MRNLLSQSIRFAFAARPPDLLEQVVKREKRSNGRDGLTGYATRACDRIHHPRRQRAECAVRQRAVQVLKLAPSESLPHDDFAAN